MRGSFDLKLVPIDRYDLCASAKLSFVEQNSLNINLETLNSVDKKSTFVIRIHQINLDCPGVSPS